MSEIAQQLSDFESAAAAALTGDEDEVSFFTEALEAPDGVVHQFAFRILVRRKQFPRVYELPVIKAGLTRGSRGSRYMSAVSAAWGPTAAWAVLTERLDSDELTPDDAKYLAYYLGERKWAKDPKPESERQRARKAFERALVQAQQRKRDR